MPLSFEKRILRRFDPDALTHALESSELDHRLLAGGSLEVQSRLLKWGNLSVSVCSYSFPVLVSGGMPSEGGVFIGLLGNARGDVSLNLRPLRLDQILLYAPGSEAHYRASTESEWMMLRLPLERLQEEAASHGIDLKWPREGIQQLDIPLEAGSRLRAELHGLLQFGQTFTGIVEAEFVGTLVSKGLIQLAVQAIASGSRPSIRKPTVGQVRALNALESSIEHWMRDPQGNLRMAEIGGTSQRLLEMACREIYGMTPQRWFKLARLNRAYRELCRGHGVSVTDVCENLGFGNMGRFAAEYRGLFGETPRQTLLRH